MISCDYCGEPITAEEPVTIIGWADRVHAWHVRCDPERTEGSGEWHTVFSGVVRRSVTLHGRDCDKLGEGALKGVQMEDDFRSRLHGLRVIRRITLREFSQRVGLAPSVYSRIERGVDVPPEDLTPIFRALGLDADDWQARELERLAVLARAAGARVLTDAEVAGKLPALPSDSEGQPLDEEKLDALVEMVRKE